MSLVLTYPGQFLRYYLYLHFTNEENEVERGCCLGGTADRMKDLGSEPRYFDFILFNPYTVLPQKNVPQNVGEIGEVGLE